MKKKRNRLMRMGIKILIQDLKENGERDILRDFMDILRTNINLKPWLRNKKRRRLWNSYWKDVLNMKKISLFK